MIWEHISIKRIGMFQMLQFVIPRNECIVQLLWSSYTLLGIKWELNGMHSLQEQKNWKRTNGNELFKLIHSWTLIFKYTMELNEPENLMNAKWTNEKWDEQVASLPPVLVSYEVRVTKSKSKLELKKARSRPKAEAGGVEFLITLSCTALASGLITWKENI